MTHTDIERHVASTAAWWVAPAGQEPAEGHTHERVVKRIHAEADIPARVAVRGLCGFERPGQVTVRVAVPHTRPLPHRTACGATPRFPVLMVAEVRTYLARGSRGA